MSTLKDQYKEIFRKIFRFEFFILFLFVIRFIAPEFQTKSTLTKHYFYFRNSQAPLKFYVYNLSLPEQTLLCLNNYCDPKANISLKHTWIFENTIHLHLLKSKTTVNDPSDADLFYVPVYFGAYNSNNGIYLKKAQISNIMIELTKYGSWPTDNGGIDHVFTQIFLQHDRRYPEAQKNFPSMISFGDISYEYSTSAPREAWRLTQMPYASNFDDYDNETKRVVSLFFIGQQSLDKGDVKSKLLRKELAQNITKMKNTVSIFTRDKKNDKPTNSFDSFNFMKKSQFCPVPAGETPSSKRLYDAFKTRCIPIILSDDLRFPFENVFCDYSAAIIQLPMKEVGFIPYVIGMLTDSEKKQIRQRIRDLSPLLSLDLKGDSHNGDMIWAWKWEQFFRAATVSASKRRHHMPNRFYKPTYQQTAQQ